MKIAKNSILSKGTGVLLILLLVFGLCGCSAITDTENKNIIVKKEEAKVPAVDIYYNISDTMAQYLADETFSKVIYSAYSAVDDAWNNTTKTIFTVGKDINTAGDNFFATQYKDTSLYTSEYANIFDVVAQSITKDKLNIIITELNTYLNDYNKISKFLIDNALYEKNAVGIIGVDSDITPFYIIVMGNNYNVSDYVTAFKNKPDIMQITNISNDEEFALDIERPINYQILAEKSGIMNIDYENIYFVKGEGDFRKIIKTDRAGLDNIEGTVNFNPQKEIIKTSGKDTRDIGAISLLSRKDMRKKYGGKVKMYIPFEIIEGVHLSTMDCEVTSELYIPDPANKSKLKKYENDYSEIIETDVAEGVTEEQGKWRVDNKTNSLIFNITLSNAATLPASSKLVKLDVTINHFSSASTLPLWIKSWDKTKTPNLVNMFSTVYNYQQKSNKASNTFTLYLGIQ